MQRVVIDTNILVSALITPDGIPARIFDAVLNGMLTMCFDIRILVEYKDVLSRRKFDFDEEENRRILETLSEKGMSVIAKPSFVAMPDENDRKFYDVAVFCDAVLITGNLKHYPREPFIVSPRDFLQNIT
jgi:putative PIN family toxin of toxin-antitoxin system